MRRRDDRGNLVIVMSIMMVLAALAIAVLARTMSGQTSSRKATEFASALGPADAGVSDALFRVDQLPSGVTPPAQFCVGSSAACLASSLPGAASTEYVATYDAVTRILTVRSKGQVNGQPHGVEAEISRSKLYRFAVFGNTLVQLNGNTTAQIVAVDEFGNPTEEMDADVGTNGYIECNGPDNAGGENNIAYPGATGVDPRCANGVLLDSGVYSPKPPVAVSDCNSVAPNVPATPCYPSTTPNCPADPTTGYLPNPLPPGKYYCQTTVRFLPGYHQIEPGSTNGGVVELFVIPPSGTANLHFEGSYVNVAPGDIDGDPTKLRVYLAGSGTIYPGTGDHAKAFTGILYAPQMTMTNEGCKVDWRGSLVVGTLDCQGGPNLTIEYDARVARLEDEDWSVKNYREIPSSQVRMP